MWCDVLNLSGCLKRIYVVTTRGVDITSHAGQCPINLWMSGKLKLNYIQRYEEQDESGLKEAKMSGNWLTFSTLLVTTKVIDQSNLSITWISRFYWSGNWDKNIKQPEKHGITYCLFLICFSCFFFVYYLVTMVISAQLITV